MRTIDPLQRYRGGLWRRAALESVNDAVMYFKNGAGNGSIEKAVYFLHPGYLGQWQEAGRDQRHTTRSCR
jgi:hypothetical protein